MKNIKLFYLLVGLLITFSCKKFVEVELPSSQIVTSTVFEDQATATAAVVNLYIQLRENVMLTGNITSLSVLLANYADEIISTDGTNAFMESNFFKNNVTATNNGVLTTWTGSYNLIYSANDIIQGLKQSTNIKGTEKNRLLGEAFFVRAYIHFYLLNLFGSIPYVTTTDYTVNKSTAKIAPDAVYKLIISDLILAKTLIPADYPTVDRVRPNRSVVCAMLARVYLYSKNWEKAQEEANEVITNNVLYQWVDELDEVFLKNSTGTLWQFAPAMEGLATYESERFNLSGLTGIPGGFMSEHLLNAFEQGDLRRTHWVANVSNDLGSWNYPNKYKQKNILAESTEYAILFRLEEQYFIRAEAKAMQGNIEGAQEDLNKIRNRAGLGDTSADSEAELIAALLKERRVELFTEHGHRFFDLKRTGNANSSLTGIKPGWKSNNILWPLPESELLLNPNLRPQNVGY